MQSLVLYGRWVARAVAVGFHNELQHQVQVNPSTTYAQAQSHARQLRLVAAASGIPKTHSPAQVLKKWSFGDDACFIAGHKVAEVLGVADGVGGWRTYGVDPSQFTQSLMASCEHIVKRGHFQADSPISVLAASYSELLNSKVPIIGSCTACIVSFIHNENTVYTANLGDSGFLVVRGGQVIHCSEEQQHYFNTPFQLSIAPSMLEGLVLNDRPESADSTSFGVEEGDIILVGTDGLFDNLSEDLILHHLSKLKDHKAENVQKIANSLAAKASELSRDPEYMSPFAISAAANGIDIKGGKPDDITVLLARVTGCSVDT